MTESSYPRVRKHKLSRRSRHERPIEVWIPTGDVNPNAAKQVRDLANRLCKAAQAQQNQPAHNTNTEQEEETS